MFQKLHHIAYRCADAQRTVDFYTTIIGLKLAATVVSRDGEMAYGQPIDTAHIFFEIGDGSYLAFFDVASSPPAQEDANTPSWVKHLAFEVPDMDALHEGKRRLVEAGYEVLGPKDHDFCQSIYFFDPDGHRLEMAVRTESGGQLGKMAADAEGELAAWNARKSKKYRIAAE